MVPTRKKKSQQKRQFSQLDETFNDLAIGNSVNVNVWDSEILEQQTDGQCNDSERVNNSLCQNQVMENKIGNQITREVSSAVMTVENRLHDAILTAIDNVVIPRVEMAVKSTTSSAWDE